MRSVTFAWCLVAVVGEKGFAVVGVTDVAVAGETDEDRELQAVGGFGSEGCSCPCDDLRDGRCPSSEADREKPEFCYKPVCEAGYYRCCSTCSMSVCANKFPMVRSRRNLFECLPCMPGDYCPGCDTRVPCTLGTHNPEAKMTEMQDCLPCDFTEKVNRDRTACCDPGNMACIDPPRDPNFGSVTSLLLPALFMLS
jgi:hypothetical protein